MSTLSGTSSTTRISGGSRIAPPEKTLHRKGREGFAKNTKNQMPLTILTILSRDERYSSPPRKRGSRACPWPEQGGTADTLAILDSRLRGNDGELSPFASSAHPLRPLR